MEANFDEIMAEEKRRLVKFPEFQLFGKIFFCKHLLVDDFDIELSRR